MHSEYARSFYQFGVPVQLSESQGWIIKRAIAGTEFYDGMGCYPLFSCENWNGLENDLESLRGQLVSLSMVIDPFGAVDQPYLLKCFKDIAKPYKEHYVVDLHKRPSEYVSEHHKRYARQALKAIKVEISKEPIQYLDEWIALYDHLIERHKIKGLARFSREAFAIQLQVPGIIGLRAIYEDSTVGMLLWYTHADKGYYHLGAYNEQGYQLRASFALFSTLIEYFADSGLRWLGLGAGAGVSGDESDGLSRFKRGWASETRTAYFCGRIFDHDNYNKIGKLNSMSEHGYFPAYRAGEFS